MAIIACGRGLRAAEAVAVFDRMLAAGLPPCLTTYTALMSLFCRVGALGEASLVLEGMKAATVQPNTITYSSLINGCEKAGNLDAALLYFDEMLVCSRLEPVYARAPVLCSCFANIPPFFPPFFPPCFPLICSA
jgi:pentatricopeptide repeat protein